MGNIIGMAHQFGSSGDVTGKPQLWYQANGRTNARVRAMLQDDMGGGQKKYYVIDIVNAPYANPDIFVKFSKLVNGTIALETAPLGTENWREVARKRVSNANSAVFNAINLEDLAAAKAAEQARAAAAAAAAKAAADAAAAKAAQQAREASAASAAKAAADAAAKAAADKAAADKTAASQAAAAKAAADAQAAAVAKAAADARADQSAKDSKAAKDRQVEAEARRAARRSRKQAELAEERSPAHVETCLKTLQMCIRNASDSPAAAPAPAAGKSTYEIEAYNAEESESPAPSAAVEGVEAAAAPLEARIETYALEGAPYASAPLMTRTGVLIRILFAILLILFVLYMSKQI